MLSLFPLGKKFLKEILSANDTEKDLTAVKVETNKLGNLSFTWYKEIQCIDKEVLLGQCTYVLSFMNHCLRSGSVACILENKS